ncbi:DEAD/DEAH box helicase [Paenibacillus sp. GYB003]|uniref:DEAD/DEAH box helicase n=1 Tax=Paenibacillus sp. GYB003 TaxID=2994392 RepID=UPI002F96AC9B
MKATFESLGIGSALAEALARHGIVEPSKIQEEAIPAVLAGGDLLAQSQTGTGKTIAYLLPIMEKIDPAAKELQAVVLTPTRELGVQVAAEIEKLGAASGIRGQALIGGAALSRQVERLKLHPHIVVGTPGRIAELLGMRKLKMHRVRTIVIDEADQMFALGAAKEAEGIIESALRDRQLLFFSATLTPDVRRLAGRWMREPREIEVDPGSRTAGGIEHLVFVCEERDKLDTLRRLVRLYDPKSALVFVNELDAIAEVASKLRHAGLSAEALYGDAPKQERTTLLGRFRSGKLQTLVATDVAARGLDIEGLTHVFHLQPALDADHYVHRAGRTGRMGRSGWSVSIVTEQEMFIIRKFEKQLGIAVHRKAMYKGQVVEPHEVRGGPARGAGGRDNGGREASARQADKPARAEAGGKPGAGSAADRRPLLARTGGFRTMGAASIRNERENAPSHPETAQRKKASERAADRKNKGAPRWLKEKQNRDPNS